MKWNHLILAITISSMLPACNDDQGQNTQAAASVEDSLPKTWFTFAPQRIKCENLSDFMVAYQKSKVYDLFLTTDFGCDVTPFTISRKFQLTSKDGREILLKLTIDSSSQFTDWEAKPLANVNKISGYLDLPADLESTYGQWVSTNALTPREACQQVDHEGPINALDCLKNMN